MHLYDMTNPSDRIRLTDEARSKGQEMVEHGLMMTRSDLVQEQARRWCTQQLAENPNLTNDPDAYCQQFVNTFTDAYFEALSQLYQPRRTGDLPQLNP